MKRYLALGLLLGFFLIAPVSATSPVMPSFRLATVVLDEWSDTILYDAQLNSIFGPLNDRITESWGFWENQTRHVSTYSYDTGDSLALVAAETGYYTAGNMVEVPDFADFDREIINVSPVRIPRRCTEYELQVSIINFDLVDVVFTNIDMGSSFGAFNALIGEDEPAQGPALVFAVPYEQISNIIFNGAHYQYSANSFCYWVYDFPIVAWDPSIETPMNRRLISYSCWDNVNVSMVLLDGWSYSECFDMRKGFPLPENETLLIDWDNQTVTRTGEPLVSFMPEVELTYFDGWQEPDYYDYKYKPKEPTDYTLLLSVAVGAIILILVLLFQRRRGA